MSRIYHLIAAVIAAAATCTAAHADDVISLRAMGSFGIITCMSERWVSQGFYPSYGYGLRLTAE